MLSREKNWGKNIVSWRGSFILIKFNEILSTTPWLFFRVACNYPLDEIPFIFSGVPCCVESMDPNHTIPQNISSLLDESRKVDPQLYDRYLRNRAIDEPACTALIAMYSVLIVLGALGNTLVIVSVIRKPAMRTPRNMFILNLAVSDLLLCTVTMPLTLMEIITKYFPLGNNVFICKIVGPLQATSIFVSTISITAIALDRYQVIVYPTKESLQLFGAVIILGLIWLLALFLSTPLYIVKQLNTHNISLGKGIDELNFCIEDWPFDHGRAYYSVFSLIFQYIVPIITVSAAYLRISYKLRYRFAAGFVSSDESSQKGRRQLRGRRLQRTNLLLGSIAIIFCISWLPLNLFNLIADLNNFPTTSQPMMIGYAVCHMMGMSSACSNPVLYGCLNENFWKEFKDILCISSEKNDASGGESQKLSIRNKFNKVLGRSKPDLVTGVTEYQPCNTASSDMTVLTKC
ncbi:neuropeptide F receptor isoform X1 [Tribolium castaneum]|uniref:Neuropeptide F receptor-like Protein n=2 Tax=Tribolium castaneum TaxID=7070 RepID=A0A139WBY5_TRICA|nr:PREDICTED: neuropeptide F receptor isoform X1 [Tribolium castaneum]XP_015839128.1 PREDICTED: neuropeptide F receptor isoform X1 [Tribolium castaneum]XP_015839129.1 PREDICTED: neuropeptide F receptor isoform X1 [Tribolium castaneum]KYB25447.1 Neuropeptide F receptor-like Protein [Tribolium castaneum]|eukprot:XP_008198436.1 PREDICTED: neuropeptide F receptor isoform X1 [Tribolium castaneum]